MRFPYRSGKIEPFREELREYYIITCIIKDELVYKISENFNVSSSFKFSDIKVKSFTVKPDVFSELGWI